MSYEEGRKDGLQEAINLVADLHDMERDSDSETSEMLVHIEHTLKSLKYGGSETPWR